eukprot:jgi/Undpi1/9982/HiC_scaffold_28.g12436.m1
MKDETSLWSRIHCYLAASEASGYDVSPCVAAILDTGTLPCVDYVYEAPTMDQFECEENGIMDLTDFVSYNECDWDGELREVQELFLATSAVTSSTSSSSLVNTNSCLVGCLVQGVSPFDEDGLAVWDNRGTCDSETIGCEVSALNSPSTSSQGALWASSWGNEGSDSCTCKICDPFSWDDTTNYMDDETSLWSRIQCYLVASEASGVQLDRDIAFDERAIQRHSGAISPTGPNCGTCTLNHSHFYSAARRPRHRFPRCYDDGAIDDLSAQYRRPKTEHHQYNFLHLNTDDTVRDFPTQSKRYTDGAVRDTPTQCKQYTDGAVTHFPTQPNRFTDGAVRDTPTQCKQYMDGVVTHFPTQPNRFTDGAVRDTPTHCKQHTDVAVTHFPTQLKRYTDGAVRDTPTQCKQYSDGAVTHFPTQLKRYTDGAVRDTPTQCKQYTDGAVTHFPTQPNRFTDGAVMRIAPCSRYWHPLTTPSRCLVVFFFRPSFLRNVSMVIRSGFKTLSVTSLIP